ncbi:MAG: hypothetical protein U0Q18_11740 [Bryobacteraceae bacterium]
MAKDWKKVARGSGVTIPDADLERIAPVLDAMEASFRPLKQTLKPAEDLAVVFHPATPEEGK